MLDPSSPFREGFQDIEVNKKETEVSSVKTQETIPSPLPDSVTAIFKAPAKVATKEISFLSSSQAYRQITRNVDISLDDYLNKDREINQLCEALAKGDWKDPIFNNPNSYPFYALVALKKGKITGVFN